MKYIINDDELRKFADVLSCNELVKFMNTHAVAEVASVSNWQNPETMKGVIEDWTDRDTKKYIGKQIEIYIKEKGIK
jgi:hypothetical protein